MNQSMPPLSMNMNMNNMNNMNNMMGGPGQGHGQNQGPGPGPANNIGAVNMINAMTGPFSPQIMQVRTHYTTTV